MSDYTVKASDWLSRSWGRPGVGAQCGLTRCAQLLIKGMGKSRHLSRTRQFDVTLEVESNPSSHWVDQFLCELRKLLSDLAGLKDTEFGLTCSYQEFECCVSRFDDYPYTIHFFSG